MIQFAAIVAVDFVFGHVAFYRVLGIVATIYGIAMARTRKIPVGIAGREPSYYLEGGAALFVGLLLTAASLALSWFAPEAVCYFSGAQECPGQN